MNSKCPKCGHEIQNGDDFCTNCGYKLKQDNVEKNSSKNNSQKSSIKRNPIQKMKILEDSSADLRKEEIKEIWKKKYFWGIIAVLAILVLIVKANILPKGYSDPDDVVDYCMRRNYDMNQTENQSDVNEMLADMFGVDNDAKFHELLQNKKTGRYVFRYSYDGESIPSYVMATRINDGPYAVEITPVKKSHIASIFKYGVSQEYMDKHFPSDNYVGYSNNDFDDMDIDLDDHISKPKTISSNTFVSYDTSENE